MNQQNQDPFIIIRAIRNDPVCKKLPAIKKRKPTVHTWTQRENIIYVEFLKANKDIMDSKEGRKSCKIFKKLAELIRTRTSMQIKSHHQKLQQKYKRSKIIISKVSELIQLGVDVVMTKDAQTSVDIKEEFIEDLTYIQSTPSINNDGQSFSQGERSQNQDVFFEDQTDNYLQIEGIDLNEQEEPLI